jgi:cyclophilin family peptidyl-prolyl cis-trans isomerase
MIRTAASALAALALTLPLAAQEGPAARAPGEIVAAAAPQDWTRIAPEDLLVMTLAPAADGTAREVVIQLMPPPFSQGWIANIRTLARAGWYDGISINRVQDNYVVQWGDPNYDNPEADGEAKPLPERLRETAEEGYVTQDLLAIPDPRGRPRMNYHLGATMARNAMIAANGGVVVPEGLEASLQSGSPAMPEFTPAEMGDQYAEFSSLVFGWPIAASFGGERANYWPVHCYGMVGVGRGMSPDTGSGAELYTVIGHAPRHLDRNIALVGRVIEGIEHLSSLPRGTGALGFYEDPAQRVPIQSMRVASDLPAAEQPRFEYLSTESESFARYAEARANRRDPFFIVPAGGADICNIPVPVRRVAAEGG